MLHKLVVMGSSSVGKSALITRLIKNWFVTEHDPTIEDSYRTQLEVDGEQCQLDILDTTGSEEYHSRWQKFLGWGEAFLCVYAVDDIKSFVDVNIFRDQLYQIKGTDRVPFVLVANKTDEANRLVTWTLGHEAARGFRVPFMEVSAKTGQGVEDAFHQLVREIRKFRAQEPKGRSQADRNQACGCKPCTVQ